MSVLADRIEEFILSKLMEEEAQITLRRNELADELQCAPSQISYVLSTRFSPARGYTVVSRRGLGGFISISRIETPVLMDRPKSAVDVFRSQLTEFVEQGLLTRREAHLAHRLTQAAVALATPKQEETVIQQLTKELAAAVKEGL